MQFDFSKAFFIYMYASILKILELFEAKFKL